jgi:hypothetical protein
MKRAIACLLLLMLGLLAFGQEQPNVYFVSVPILKILSHPEGYKVLYMRNSDMKVDELYIPHRWFSKAGGKAEIVFGKDPSYPYFTVFYRDGKFDFIRLYVMEDVRDLTWGVLRKTEASNAAFGGETLEVKY